MAVAVISLSSAACTGFWEKRNDTFMDEINTISHVTLPVQDSSCRLYLQFA